MTKLDSILKDMLGTQSLQLAQMAASLDDAREALECAHRLMSECSEDQIQRFCEGDPIFLSRMQPQDAM